jgi:hypothetical protein
LVCEGVRLEDDVFVGHGVVFINTPRPRATIHGPTQAEIDSTIGSVRVVTKDVAYGATGSAKIDYYDSVRINLGLFQKDFKSVISGNERAHLSLQAAGVRARRYERDSALRGLVPAGNGA